MKYYANIFGIFFGVMAIVMMGFSIANKGQDRLNYVMFSLLFGLIAQVHMLEQTIINNIIRPEKIVVNLNGETVLETSKKEVGIEE